MRMTPRTALIMTTLIVCTLLATASANAVCPEPHPPVCAEFFHSDVVLVGELLSKRDVLDEEGLYEGWYYDFAVQKTFRGKVHEGLTIFMANDSARLPFALEKGRRYLLFASPNPAGGLIMGDSCGGNAGPLPESQDSIRQIEAIKTSSAGEEIRGRIVEQADSNKPLRGVRVVARGDQEQYEALTDDSGWFSIGVPPGRYVVQAESPGWSFRAFELSYDDPNRIVIEDGSCTAIQFQATTTGSVK